MPRIKLGDKATINATKYNKENSETFLGFSILDPAISRKISAKINSKSIGEVVYSGRGEVDVTFSDGFTAVLSRKTLDLI